MKNLYNFILESLDIQFLLLSFEDAMEYFNKHGIFKDKATMKSGLDESDIKKLYDYAEEYSMPCPIVANYQRKSGRFVFRRWVAKISDDLNIDVYKNAGRYKGLHNTKLKEDGKFFPSSEDFEYIISYSHNKNNLDMYDVDNIEYVFSKKLESNSKMEQLMMYYSDNEESCKRMIEPLKGINSKLYKLPTEDKAVSEWYDLGDYKRYGKKPNNTPKTDVISADGKYKISLKKSGGAQLASGYECESRATLMCCIDHIEIEEDKNLLLKLLQKEWYQPTKDGRNISQKKSDGDEELLKAEKEIKNMSAELNGIILRNPKFKMAVMREAATGEIKFGANSRSCANYVLVWSDIKNDNRLYEMDEYLDHCYNSAKFNLGFKTAGNSQVALRIMVK